jgi:DNA-binding transcriptional ArsR family regulator
VTPGPRKITDPRAIKAMAHPLRLAALDALGGARSLTATEVAEAVGTSPSSMSYHLRELARWGFVERDEAEGDGRERPWRSVPGGVSFEFDDPALGPAAAAAGNAVTTSILARVSQNLADFYARDVDQPPQWRQVTTINNSTAWLTVEEAGQLATLQADFLSRVGPRTPEERPAGSRRVRAVHIVVPLELD